MGERAKSIKEIRNCFSFEVVNVLKYLYRIINI
jgi:hypothetical protein